MKHLLLCNPNLPEARGMMGIEVNWDEKIQIIIKRKTK